ncbi:MAG: NAD(P)H-dependent oxidoreductase [Bacteroidota bacterium]
MKTVVISYSYTGNNAVLAAELAARLGARHVEVRETKNRTLFTIILDVLFNRRPGVEVDLSEAGSADHVIFVAPVWLGAVAAPMRAVFDRLREKVKVYSLVSFSAGADGPNTGLEKDLVRRMGRRPVLVLNPLITEFLPADPIPTRKELDAYRLNERVAARLAEQLAAKWTADAGEALPFPHTEATAAAFV